MSKRVFLGGTCNGSEWREGLIPFLKLDYYNPVVPEWNDEAYQRELLEREQCDYLLYFITPKKTGDYAIAEVIDDSNKRPERTIFIYSFIDGDKTFDEAQIKSLNAVGKMVERNGAIWVKDIIELLRMLNESE